MQEELERISTIVCSIGKIPQVEPDQDFYEAGVSSVASLSLLMELESAYDVSIPDEQFVAARTVRAIYNVIARLRPVLTSGDAAHA